MCYDGRWKIEPSKNSQLNNALGNFLLKGDKDLIQEESENNPEESIFQTVLK